MMGSEARKSNLKWREIFTRIPNLTVVNLEFRVGGMSELLAKAFKKASEELPAPEQDALAEWLLELLENDERIWDEQFAASADKLGDLANKALAEYGEGRTGKLDFKKLSKP
jgi:hypothetical protein